MSAAKVTLSVSASPPTVFPPIKMLPVKFMSPPTDKLFCKVTSPTTVNVPEIPALVKTEKSPDTVSFPPTYKFSEIPTPPATINEPVEVLVDPVVLLITVSPVTVSISFSVVEFATVNVEFNSVALPTSNVPTISVLPVKKSIVNLLRVSPYKKSPTELNCSLCMLSV